MDVVHKRRAVAYWLLAGVFMIIIQTLLGGITRLTGSGLSITQWKPIMGALPPMNDKEWQEAFNGYKQIGQYKYLNSDFTLSDFQFIFFWEWFHRLWARMLGVVFAIGFIYFFIKKYFDKNMVVPFVVLFILGGLQGLIGWVMVSSGLNDSHLYVDHIKLAIHFLSAMLLACYTLWFALQLLVNPDRRITNTSLHNLTIGVICLLSVQLLYGAFMAGLHAGITAPTWPSINGMWLPASLGNGNITGDKINVQFIHRGLAYLLLLLLIVWFMKVHKADSTKRSLLATTGKWPMLLVALQVLLGIFTVISAPYIQFGKFGRYQLLAELHQLVAMFLLMSLLVNLYVVRKAGKTDSTVF
ncbi:MAG: COX15/CtaA family protein [Taibaiella sp.]|nr:COX15/CtaA family protein [Taibaiella sp.]